jgi:predicted GIY-YIG superfamily endonuclease
VSDGKDRADDAARDNAREPAAYRVYVIELSPEVMGKKRVADENAGRREDKPCVYVGQTARTPEERFAQHKNGKRSSRFVREFGVQLKPRLYRNWGPYATRAEAEAAETRLAEKLRRRGYAVWSR